MAPGPDNLRSSNPRRPVLVAGLGLLGLSAAVFVASLMFASSAQPGLREAAGALRGASPWLLLAGALLMLLWFVVNRAARTPVTKKSESTLFSESTQLGDASDDRDATNRR